MRIDKFLWCVRYQKTRSLSTRNCKKGAVRVNGEIAKPSKEVFPGDKIQFRKNQINYQIEVLDIPDSRVGAKLVGLYIKDLTPPEAFETSKMLSQHRKKGLGRPTKKDRRDLEDFLNSEQVNSNNN